MSRRFNVRAALAGTAIAALAATALTGCGAAKGTHSARAGATGPSTGSSPGSPSGSSSGPGGAASTPPSPPKSTSGDNVPPGGTLKASPVLEYYTGAQDRSVALTFDDGPSPVWTPKILAVLAKYHAHATFCEIGPNARANPAMVQAIRAAGDQLCDHTVSHNEAMSKRPLAYQTQEIVGAKEMIEKAGGSGTQVSWFRAPGGDFSPPNRTIAAQNGLRPLAWSVDTTDWERPGVGAIVSHVHHELSKGAIILMHDGGGDRSQTVAALNVLLPQLIHAGYSFDFPAK
ncbi:polysaccharide deacetylase family protein [Streptacidiphilus sp. N1-12]|uniref:Polysaccharide deacetylase family protein n=2 Tax=Streptacidiphilus alkalitolerans TaxID=3342712 RepID=A0ABV6WEV3_9ACTN